MSFASTSLNPKVAYPTFMCNKNLSRGCGSCVVQASHNPEGAVFSWLNQRLRLWSVELC
jgi:hypothetical protein